VVHTQLSHKGHSVDGVLVGAERTNNREPTVGSPSSYIWKYIGRRYVCRIIN
jgi:hypothetical protein